MNTDRVLEQLEDSNLPQESIEVASESVSFAQSFHDLLHDWGMAKEELDFVDLEKAVDGFMAELSAASIFLASFKDLDVKLRLAAERCQTDGSPELIVLGYRKLADRVTKTRESLLSNT
jgi:hypothetical protein